MTTKFFLPILFGLFILACGRKGGDSKPRSAKADTAKATPAVTDVTTPTQKTEPPKTEPEPPRDKNVDLGISNVRVRKVNQGGSLTYEFSADLVNTGPDPAVFDCNCNWSCPGGQILTNFVSIIQGGYLSSGRQMNYSGFNFRPCEPVPTFLSVTCEIKARSGHVEANMANNKWVGNLNMY